MAFTDKYCCDKQKRIEAENKRFSIHQKIIAEWEKIHGEAIGAEYEEYYYRRLKEMGF